MGRKRQLIFGLDFPYNLEAAETKTGVWRRFALLFDDNAQHLILGENHGARSLIWRDGEVQKPDRCSTSSPSGSRIGGRFSDGG